MELPIGPKKVPKESLVGDRPPEIYEGWFGGRLGLAPDILRRVSLSSSMAKVAFLRSILTRELWLLSEIPSIPT